MRYKHNTAYKLISILLIALHVCVFSLRDAAIVFAEEASATESVADTADTQEASDKGTDSAEVVEEKGSEVKAQAEGLMGMSMAASSTDSPLVPGNSSGFNLNALQNVYPSLFTGALTYSLPIAVPTGRRGIQPNIAIAYSSQSGNGILGMGWFLDLGSIERSTKNGVPKYNSSDTFIFKSGGSTAELVNIGGNEYRAKIEEAFMKFTFDGYYWEVKDKSGITYYFGQTTSSQQNSGANVFSWRLDKVRDTLGNYMTLTYIKAEGQIYPDTIDYTGFDGSPSLAPTFQVDFDYSDNRSDYFFSYRSKFLIKTNKLLSTIMVKQNGSRIRKYSLTYQQSPTTNRSLISSITQYGDDDSASLPPITFQYQQAQPGWQLDSAWVLPAEAKFVASYRNDQGVRLVDMNKDGLTDLVRGYEDAGGGNPQKYIYQNNPDKTWTRIDSSAGKLLNIFNRGGIICDAGMRLVDVNADGWLDLIRAHDVMTLDSAYYSYLSNSQINSWYRDDAWLMPTEMRISYTYDDDGQWPDPVYYTGVVFEDVNSDGYSDIVKAENSDRRSYLSNGPQIKNWTRNTSWDMPDGAFQNGSTQFTDVNADGLPDFVIADGSNKKTYLNNGGNWTYDSGRTIPDGDLRSGGAQLLDINSDGLADIIIAKGTDRKTYINNGTNWQRQAQWDMPDGDLDNGGTRFADINGDGLVDILIYYSDTPQKVYLGKGPFPDLLSSISNGIGGQVSLTYDTYIGRDNTEAADKGNLGFPVNVVTQIATSDGRGSSYSTAFSYDKGKFDYAEREFSGFGKVKVTDADGNYSFSYFLQDEYTKGRAYKQESYDSSGVIQAKVENTWVEWYGQPYAGYNDVKFICLFETNNYTYNNGTATKRTKTEYGYWDNSPQFGNLTHITEYGQVDVNDGSDIGTDKFRKYIGYLYNQDSWIASLVRIIFVYDINDNYVSRKFFYYDNFTTPPPYGLLTYEESPCYNPVTGSEIWPEARYTYDAYGNLLTATDDNNHTSTTTYDSTYHIFPLTVTNHLGHTVTSQYYGVNGVPLDDGNGLKGLFGQVKSTQDPNAVIAYNTYDDLGRLVKAIGPNDSLNYPGAIYEYDLEVTDPLTDPLKLTQRVKSVSNPTSLAYPNYYISYSFYDGIGRLIESKSPAETDPNTGAPRQIISGITEYNNRGHVDKKYLPYFVNSSPDFVAPIYSQPYSSFQYDSLGRVIQTTNPDSTYSTVSYSDWTVTATDESGNYKTHYYDAYQRLIQVDEHNDGAIYTTTYAYDTLGNLIAVTDHPGNTTTITYDTLGRKVRMNDPDMGIWQYEYDSVGNLTKQTDAAGQVLRFSYDALNRLTQKTIQSAQAVTYVYDDPGKANCKGRLSKVTYEAGKTEFFYDNLGRETQSIKTVDFINYNVQRSYDPLDRLVSLTYPDSEVVTYTYNPQGIEAVIGSTTYVANIDYAPTSQISKIAYGNGTTTEYSYDPNSLRLTNLKTNNQQLTTIQNLDYSFDSVGNISRIYDNVHGAAQTFEYDDLNRITYANGTYYGAVNYAYDSTGNILTKGTLSLNYVDLRPHAVSSYTDSATGQTVNFTYDANGNMSRRLNAQTGEQSSYYYDYESHLTRVEQSYPQGTATEVVLEFNQGWNFFSLPVIPNNSSISQIFAGFQVGVDYDQISRYDPETDTFESYVGDAQFDEFNTLEYGQGYCIYVNNPAGLRVTLNGTTAAPQNISLLNGWNLIPYPYLSSRLTQEALGNLDYGVDYDSVLSYNQATGQFIEYPGSLSQLEPNKSYYLHCLRDTTWILESLSRTTSFYYDGDGGRVKRRSEIDQANTTTYIGSLFEKVVYDNTQNPTKIKKHIYAGANRVCVVDSGSLRFYHGDHLGSSNIITDGSGAEVARHEYRPFGSVAYQDGTYETDVKYTGKIQDDTGLYYYGARYYDPVIGRFISPDSIVQAPQDPQTLNRYAYCRNNPLKYVDPTGHFIFAVIVAICKAVASYAVSTMLPGAIVGSLIGGGLAAATGGDIGRGFAMGAISGAIMGGIGGFGLKGGMAILANGVGGAASGAINASIFGGDIGKWAMIGGLSGLAFGSISQLGVAADGSSSWQWDLGRLGLSGIAGGAISEIAGGDFWEGATIAGAIAGADFLYRGVMNTSPDAKGKRGTAETADTPGQQRVNQKNEILKVDVSKNPNTVGLAEQSGARGPVHFLFGETGPVMNFFGMRIPFLQGTSKFHDNLTTGFRQLLGGGTIGMVANGLLFNIPSMVPSFAINVMSAAMNDYPALVGQSVLYGEESN